MLKKARRDRLTEKAGFSFHKVDLAHRAAMEEITRANPAITRIIHLATQAGERYSLENPHAYAASNPIRQILVLERPHRLDRPQHHLYPSSSPRYEARTAAVVGKKE